MNRGRPFINRILRQKQLELTDIYHDHNMKEMKPVTSKFMEHSETITINNSKREMIKETREQEIERQNRLLLEKISNVIAKKGNYSVSRTKTISVRNNKSLNEIARKKQLESIQIENKQLLNRLNSKRTTLNTLKFKKDWEESRSLIKRMENSQFNLLYFKYKEAGSKTKKANTNLAEKIDRLNISQFKVINGQKMLIKMIFNDGFLHIIGDNCGKKDLKLIKIAKNQALNLIESTCQGKIQNLWQKLRYDNESQTLYIANESEDECQHNPQKRMRSKLNNKLQSLTHRINKSSLQHTPSTNKSQMHDFFLPARDIKSQKNTSKYEQILKQQAKPNEEQQYQEQQFQEPNEQQKHPEITEVPGPTNNKVNNENQEIDPSAKEKVADEVYQQDYNQEFQQEQENRSNA